MSETFRGGRIAALAHMRQAENAGFEWKEETVTDILLANTNPHVKAIPFTKRQEAKTGADWLWWWIDSSGEAFGMLVQAKRLRVSRTAWTIDFEYKKGKQRKALLEAANVLAVPPVYALYMGTPRYRQQVPCGSNHRKGYCVPCHAYAVALMAAMIANPNPISDGPSAYQWTTPLESVDYDNGKAAPWNSKVTAALSPELRTLLFDAQGGSRAIAKSLLNQFGFLRLVQFSAGTAEQVTDEKLMPPFADVPDDRTHGGLAYFSHVLQGLRPTVPGYVLAAESGEDPAPYFKKELGLNLSGLVIVRMGDSVGRVRRGSPA